MAHNTQPYGIMTYDPLSGGVIKADKQDVEDMFNYLVSKWIINLKEFKDFKENRELIEKIN